MTTGADLFVSIHLNSMPTTGKRKRVTGVETYFLSADASGADAARVPRPRTPTTRAISDGDGTTSPPSSMTSP